MIKADGHDTLVTQICVRGSEYLEPGRCLFRVPGRADRKTSTGISPGKAPDGRQMDGPFHTMDYD